MTDPRLWAELLAYGSGISLSPLHIGLLFLLLLGPQPLRRGAVVTVAATGVSSGQPRPAVVVQADRWLPVHPSVTLCPLTSTLIEAPLVRLPVLPSRVNGLQKPSQLMVDKLFTVPIQAIGEMVGQLEPQALVDLDLALRDWLQLP
jgi:mRNA interferase MazF